MDICARMALLFLSTISVSCRFCTLQSIVNFVSPSNAKNEAAPTQTTKQLPLLLLRRQLVQSQETPRVKKYE